LSLKELSIHLKSADRYGLGNGEKGWPKYFWNALPSSITVLRLFCGGSILDPRELSYLENLQTLEVHESGIYYHEFNDFWRLIRNVTSLTLINVTFPEEEDRLSMGLVLQPLEKLKFFRFAPWFDSPITVADVLQFTPNVEELILERLKAGDFSLHLNGASLPKVQRVSLLNCKYWYHNDSDEVLRLLRDVFPSAIKVVIQESVWQEATESEPKQPVLIAKQMQRKAFVSLLPSELVYIRNKFLNAYNQAEMPPTTRARKKRKVHHGK
jgi:hypothetical protein